MKSEKIGKKGIAAIIIFGGMALLSALLALLAFILPSSMQNTALQEYFSTARVSTEMMHVLLGLLAVLPIAIGATAVVLLFREKDEMETEIVGDVSTAPAPPAPVAPAASVQAAPAASATAATHGAGGQSLPAGMKKGDPNAIRFKMLTEIDQRAAKRSRPPYDDTLTLPALCERFRSFAAANLGLYYEIDDVRKFIASLGVSPIVILQGMSGTGKTSFACAFGKFVHHDAAVVPVQPMWKERSDMIGYFNEFTERFNETSFLCTLYEASYSEDVCLTVLDEMNIARVVYYFADFLSLLELPRAKDRLLTVTSETRKSDPKLLFGGRFCIPENMWYIGTANNDDSTFAISDKVYDRAMIMNLEHKAKPFRAEPNEGVYLSYAHFRTLVEGALEEHHLSDAQRANLMTLDKYLIENFHVTFGNRIMKQIERYVPLYVVCGGTEEEALDDMISQKLFRKLEVLNPVYVRAAAPGLLQTLHDVFGETAMPKCCAYVQRLYETL